MVNDEESRVSQAQRQVFPRLQAQSRPKLMAVVPAYNEANSISGVISELQNLKLSSCDVEFVVVDDGSLDGTADKARQAGAQVISLPFNLGIGVGVQTGFQYALLRGASFVVQVDGDGQHIPSEIEKLLVQLHKGADVIVGSRFTDGQKDGLRATTPLRWLVSRLLAWTVQFLAGNRISDTTSGFRIFNRRAAEFIAHRYPDDYPEVEVLVLLARYGFKIDEVSVQMRGRVHGQSSINWWRSAYYVLKVTFASIMDKVRR